MPPLMAKQENKREEIQKGKKEEKNEPRDSIPSLVAHVEDQILGVRIDRSRQDLLPILEVRPRFIGRRARERRVARPMDQDTHEFERGGEGRGGEDSQQVRAKS